MTDRELIEAQAEVIRTLKEKTESLERRVAFLEQMRRLLHEEAAK